MFELGILILLLLGLNLYVVFGGADFGAGIWEFTTALQSSRKEKEHIYKAIGPVWEANHVWLIFVLVILFSATPAAFALLCEKLWLPFLLALVGIVFRGASYVYRSSTENASQQKWVWEAAFAVASILAPFFLGISFGAVASGQILDDSPFPWLTSFSLFCGFFFVAMCTYLSSVYLTREAHLQNKTDLVRLWKKRSLSMGLWMGILSFIGIVFLWMEAPLLWNSFLQKSELLPLLSSVSGILALVCLWKNRFHLASLFSIGAVTFVLWGWALAQFPFLILPDHHVQNFLSAPAILEAMFYSLVFGMLLLIPSFYFLFSVFKK